MAVPGRVPKPDGQKRHRNKPTADWVEVPDVPFADGPRLPARQPDGRAWPAWTKRWWATVSSMPHCVTWSLSDWEFAFATAAVAAKLHTEPTASMAVELRNREKVLGTTAEFRRALRIRYVSPAADEDGLDGPGGAAGVTRLDDYREL